VGWGSLRCGVMAIRVGVFGAAGRMGSTVCQAVLDDPELDLVAAVDPHHVGMDLRQVARVDADLVVAPGPDALLDAGAEVVVDFTHLDAACENLTWAADHGVHAVVGTTGFAQDDLDRFAASFTRSGCLIAPNFAIGAVLMMRFAEIAAPFFETAEVIELHHDGKLDAPSGTAMQTVERMAAASGDWGADPTRTEVLPAARGAEGPAGIHVHSVRLRGLVAHQEVLLGTTGQTLTVRHDSYDRSSFMPGVVLAVKAIGDRIGLTVGLDALLFDD
jgi:4-hydroxy-tetrahydrodipicolinate reductase